jgi:spore germination protein
MPVVSEDIEEKVELLSIETDLLREGRDKLRLKSGKEVEGGKIQHVQTSEELAGKGILEYLTVFIRTAENPLLANISVIDGSPKEMMEKGSKFKDKDRIAIYINDLLEDNRKLSQVPEMRIYEFASLVYSKTTDPITPYLKYSDTDVEVAGSALFKGDKMVGKINVDETTLLLAMIGTNNNIAYIYHGNEIDKKTNDLKNGAAILIKQAKQDIKIKFENDKPQVNIQLKCKGVINEFDGLETLDDDDYKKKIENILSKDIKSRCENILKKLQEVGADPLGLRELLRAYHNDYWRKMDWDEVYKDIKFNVDAKMEIEFYGAMT